MTRRCLHCRKPFWSLHKGTLLCSDECRRAHMRRYQAAYRERTTEKLQPLQEDRSNGTMAGSGSARQGQAGQRVMWNVGKE
jgi:hypothetical protein